MLKTIFDNMINFINGFFRSFDNEHVPGFILAIGLAIFMLVILIGIVIFLKKEFTPSHRSDWHEIKHIKNYH